MADKLAADLSPFWFMARYILTLALDSHGLWGTHTRAHTRTHTHIHTLHTGILVHLHLYQQKLESEQVGGKLMGDPTGWGQNSLIS